MKQHRDANWRDSEDGQFCARNLDHPFLASLFESGCKFGGLTEKQLVTLNKIRDEFNEYFAETSKTFDTYESDPLITLIEALEETLSKVKNKIGRKA